MEARETPKGIITNLLTWQSSDSSPEAVCSLQGPGFPRGFFTGVYGYTSQIKISTALNMSSMHAGTNLKLYKVIVRSSGEFSLSENIENCMISVCYPVKKAIRLKLTGQLMIQGNLKEAIDHNPQLIAEIFDLDWVAPCNAILWEAVRDFGCGPVALKFCTLRNTSFVEGVEHIGGEAVLSPSSLKVAV